MTGGSDLIDDVSLSQRLARMQCCIMVALLGAPWHGSPAPS